MARTIVLIEDDADITDIINLILEPHGFEINSYKTGKHVIASTEPPPDLFIVDGNLPDMNGVEVCIHLKGNPLTMNTPIIFMSASKRMCQQVLEQELADVIEKPFEAGRLLKVVRARVPEEKMANS